MPQRLLVAEGVENPELCRIQPKACCQSGAAMLREFTTFNQHRKELPFVGSVCL